LVADDQPSNRELLEELPTTQGFTVITACDGASVLEKLARVQVDLVLLDVMMPHLNGFEACARIKNNPETYLIPVVLITALCDKQDRIEGIKAGADDFLTRPVDRTELLARVRIDKNLSDIAGRSDTAQFAREALTLSDSNSRIAPEIFLLRDRALVDSLLAFVAEESGEAN
jgi:two-component system cell cycle response regulator